MNIAGLGENVKELLGFCQLLVSKEYRCILVFLLGHSYSYRQGTALSRVKSYIYMYTWLLFYVRVLQIELQIELLVQGEQ